MKKGILVLTANIIPIIIFFFLGEVYLRTLGIQPYVRTFPGQYENDPKGVFWAQSDSSLGWVSNKLDPEMNSQGFRAPKDFSTVDPNSEKIRVMVLGDSFVWGAGVKADENIPSLLQAKLGDRYEFFNLGVPGWGIDQMYLAYQQYKDVIQPDIVILTFIDDDVNRVLEAYRLWEGMNKPSFAVKNDELVLQTSGSGSQLLLNRLMARSVFFSKIMQQIYLATEARAIVQQIFLNLTRETRHEQRGFVVIRIPTQDHFDPIARIDRQLYSFEDMLQNTGALYLEPSELITHIPNWEVDFYLDDGHMSVAGNQYLADYIFGHVFGESRQLSNFSYQD